MDDETIDLNQVAVESRVHDLESALVDLAAMRLDPATRKFVTDEQVNLSRCLTGLQMIMSHIAEHEGRTARLRVVK